SCAGRVFTHGRQRRADLGTTSWSSSGPRCSATTRGYRGHPAVASPGSLGGWVGGVGDAVRDGESPGDAEQDDEGGSEDVPGQPPRAVLVDGSSRYRVDAIVLCYPSSPAER